MANAITFVFFFADHTPEYYTSTGGSYTALVTVEQAGQIDVRLLDQQESWALTSEGAPEVSWEAYDYVLEVDLNGSDSGIRRHYGSGPDVVVSFGTTEVGVSGFSDFWRNQELKAHTDGPWED